MPKRQNFKAMTINKNDLAFKVGGGGTTVITSTTPTPTTNDYELKTLTANYTVVDSDARFIDLYSASNMFITLPTTAITTGKTITFRNTTNETLFFISTLNTESFTLKPLKQITVVFTGTLWTLADDRNIDFGRGSYNVKKASASFVGNAGANSDCPTGIAFGNDAFVKDTASFGVAIGASAKVSQPLQFTRGGYLSNPTRVTEEMRNVTQSFNRHKASRVQWAGTIATALGLYPIYLGGLSDAHFTTQNNSIITGYFKLNGIRRAGGSEAFSTLRALTIQRGGGANTLQIVNNTDIYTYNADVGILDFSLVPNGVTGNIELFVQSGSIVRAYDTNWTAEFDFIETLI